MLDPQITGLTVGLLVVPMVLNIMRPAERFALTLLLRQGWPVVRPILGWFMLGLGVLGLVLPVLQGVLFLVIGAALVGKRNPLIRRVRVFYKLLVRRMARSSQPLVAWLGQRAQQGLLVLRHQIRHFHERHTERMIERRAFRLALVPDAAVSAYLNYWRRRYDPAYRRRLPPHIALISTSRSLQRRQVEQWVRTVCAEQQPFWIGLDTVHPIDERLLVSIDAGREELECLQARICAGIDEPLRRSVRPIWPSLTIGKIRNPHVLATAYEYVETEFTPQRWIANRVVLFEERFGHIWYRVRDFPFGQ